MRVNSMVVDSFDRIPVSIGMSGPLSTGGARDADDA